MEPQNAIYDARQLGMPRMLILGVQHLFAMFGATVLVPLLTGLDVSITLLFAGIGTLLFHFISKWNVPAFLGSSFAFLGGYASVKEMGMAQGLSETLALDYACLGVAFAGLMYFVMAALIRSFGIKKVLQFLRSIQHFQFGNTKNQRQSAQGNGFSCRKKDRFQISTNSCHSSLFNHFKYFINIAAGKGEIVAVPFSGYRNQYASDTAQFQYGNKRRHQFRSGSAFTV